MYRSNFTSLSSKKKKKILLIFLVNLLTLLIRSSYCCLKFATAHLKPGGVGAFLIDNSLIFGLPKTCPWGSWMGGTDARAVSRSITRAAGAPSAMTPGTWRMLRSSAASWGAAGLFLPLEMPILVKAQERSFSTTCIAKGMRLTSGSAPAEGGWSTTACTWKMPAPFAQVRLAALPHRADPKLNVGRKKHPTISKTCWFIPLIQNLHSPARCTAMASQRAELHGVGILLHCCLPQANQAGPARLKLFFQLLQQSSVIIVFSYYAVVLVNDFHIDELKKSTK